MAGIYIHIPFCKKACHYCNFHFSTSLKHKSRMLNAINHELAIRSKSFSNKIIDTIYFGGGTPSLLSKIELKTLLDSIKDCYSLSHRVEISFEANPDDLCSEKIDVLLDVGINRLSIGIQSMSDSILFQMNRTHSSLDAINAVRLARTAGFNNISIDLMFGLPNLDIKQWEETLVNSVELGVTHLSCYNLTIEERTALWHFVNKNEVRLPAEQNQSAQFLLADSILTQRGFEHYEISNYAIPDFRSKHNSNYWNRTAYLGFGPSAHSFIDNIRRWNISNNSKYMNDLKDGMKYWEEEVLSEYDRFNEHIMLGLRTSEGIEKDELKKFRFYKNVEFQDSISALIENNSIIESETHLSLKKENLFLCDYFSSKLFLSNDE